MRIYQIFTKTENTDWTKFQQHTDKQFTTYLVQEYLKNRVKAIKKGYPIVDVKVRVTDTDIGN